MQMLKGQAHLHIQLLSKYVLTARWGVHGRSKNYDCSTRIPDPSNYAETMAWHAGLLLQPYARPLANPPKLAGAVVGYCDTTRSR